MRSKWGLNQIKKKIKYRAGRNSIFLFRLTHNYGVLCITHILVCLPRYVSSIALKMRHLRSFVTFSHLPFTQTSARHNRTVSKRVLRGVLLGLVFGLVAGFVQRFTRILSGSGWVWWNLLGQTIWCENYPEFPICPADLESWRFGFFAVWF